eukprot:GSMAST32.ASY1.ANO1.1520.1 assembled CDS
MPFTAYIVDCCRTPGGKRQGSLREWHPADLGAVVVNALLARNNLTNELGSQAGNLARNIILSSNLPESVPGTTVDRQCGSSQQALHFAVQAVMSGTQDVIIAGGVECMTLVPIGANITDGMKAGHERYPDVMFSQFAGAELVAEKAQLSRENMEEFALLSHKRAHRATREGRFVREIIPIAGVDKDDEGIRWPNTKEKLRKLPLLQETGKLTAATASQITDGASAMLVCNERGLKKLNLSPRARIVSIAVVGSCPIMMLYGPIPATRLVLQKANLTIDEIDLYEVNEAFASVPLCFLKECGGKMSKLNVNGGAMSLGHPLGATGTKICTTLLCELERRNKRFGLQAICEGGGTANALILECLNHQCFDSKL